MYVVRVGTFEGEIEEQNWTGLNPKWPTKKETPNFLAADKLVGSC